MAKQGFLDITAHDYELVFGVDVQTGMDKANRWVMAVLLDKKYLNILPGWCTGTP